MSKQPNGIEMRRQRDLRLNEQIIESARQSFLDMGRALAAIRDERLYVGEFDTFDDYALDRWEMTARQAYRLIACHQVDLILRPIGHTLKSEAAARELVPIAGDTPTLVAVYEEAVRRAAGGRVTAALVKASRDALAPTIIDGEWSDDDAEVSESGQQAPSDPLAVIPAAQAAIAAALTSRAAPADVPEEDHRDVPGDAAEGEASVVPAEPSRDETEAEDAASRQSSAEVDERQQERAGVSAPAAAPERSGGNEERGQVAVPVPAPPVPVDGEDEEAEKARVHHEMRERMTATFCQAIANLTLGMPDDPRRWLDEIFLPGVFKTHGLPSVERSLTAESMKTLSSQMYALADYMQETGRDLL